MANILQDAFSPDSIFATALVGQPVLSTVNQIIVFNANIIGNIVNTGGTFDLKAGAKYELEASIHISTNANAGSYRWFNVTAGVYIGATGKYDDTTPVSIESISKAFIFPTIATQVQVRLAAVPFVGGAVDPVNSYIVIKQIG